MSSLGSTWETQNSGEFSGVYVRNTELWWVLWGLCEKHRTMVGPLGSTWETQNYGGFSGVYMRNTELWWVLWGLCEKHRTMVSSLWVDTRMEVVNTRWSSDGLGRLHLKGSRNLVTSVGLIPAQRDEKHYQLEGGWDHIWVYKYSDFLVSASLVPRSSQCPVSDHKIRW